MAMFAGIDVCSVNKGDTVFVWLEQPMPHDRVDAIKQQWEESLPDGVKVAVVGPGVRLTVVKQAA